MTDSLIETAGGLLVLGVAAAVLGKVVKNTNKSKTKSKSREKGIWN
mgnify:CR=1 FL=1